MNDFATTRLAALIWMLSLASSTAAMNGTPSRIYEGFATKEFDAATSHLEAVFRVGVDAIPALVDLADRDDPFFGFCGAGQLSSEIEITLHDENAPPPEALNQRITSLGNVAVYLIAAILEGDLYFATHCRPTSSSVSVDLFLAEIRRVSHSLSAMNEEQLGEVLLRVQSTSGITFDRTTKPLGPTQTVPDAPP